MQEMTTAGAVFVQSNESDNRVITFARGEDGALTQGGSFETGGAGDAKPHLTSQGSAPRPTASPSPAGGRWW